MQSREEFLRVFLDWKTFYAPQNLIDSPRTGELLADYVVKNGGVASFTILNAAVAALGSQVLTPELSEKEKAAEIAAKQEERMRRDYQDSIRQRSVTEVQKNNSQDAAEAKQKAEAKELASIKSEIAREIGSYTVGSPSGRGINYAATESGRSKLQKVAGAYPLLASVAAAKQTLENVRSAKYQLP